MNYQGGIMSNTLEPLAPESEKKDTPAASVGAGTPSAEPIGRNAAGIAGEARILRFAKSERLLHWSIAGPFLVSFATGIILAIIYNPDPSRPYRNIFAVLHRVSGVAFVILPMLTTFQKRGDAAIHFYNIKQAWTWVFDDFRWLALMGLSTVSKKIKLPEQGKFNAAEKVNFMVLMATYPLYIVTGLLMWFTHVPVLSWILHFLMAMLATPLIVGHLYMALINKSTRPGLDGMISGHVDRHWAKHHYRRWYREHHEASE
jgi:formate dehydrogenase subunit gamma